MKIEINNPPEDFELWIDGVPYAVGDKPPKPQENRWSNALDVLEPLKTTGAWGRSNGGRGASAQEVNFNADRLPGDWYIPRVEEAATEFGLPVWILLGIFDRESNHGRSLDNNGYGDAGNGFGVGQVDSRYHTQAGKPDPYALEHMKQCCEIFTDYLRQIEQKHSGWADKYVLKGATVAYNSGVSNVVTISGMDKGTTGSDYGADTCCRMQLWKQKIHVY